MGIPELIKALRCHDAGCYGCGYEHNCNHGNCVLMMQAAAALEKLNDFEHSQCAKLLAERDRYKALLAVKSEQLESLRTIFYEITGSIPSKVPLPKASKEEAQNEANSDI